MLPEDLAAIILGRRETPNGDMSLKELAAVLGAGSRELLPSLGVLLRRHSLGASCDAEGQILFGPPPTPAAEKTARAVCGYCAERLLVVERACGMLENGDASASLRECASRLLGLPLPVSEKDWQARLLLLYRTLCCGILLFRTDETLTALTQGMRQALQLLGRVRDWCRLTSLLFLAEDAHAHTPEEVDALLAKYLQSADEGEALNALDHMLLGQLHFLRGEFAEGLNWYEAYSLSPSPRPTFDEMFAIRVSTACLYCKRDHVSYGIITSHRNTAELTGHNRYALIWRVHNVFFLLRAGEAEQAIAHIDQLLRVAEGAGQTEMASVCRRALAVYHFQQRRRNEARRILAADAREGRAALPVSDPQVLEMIAELEKDGAPVPGYALREMAAELEKGPNRLLRGVCLRLRAALPETSAPLRCELLRESCSELSRTGNIREELLSVEALIAALEAEKSKKERKFWRQREKELLALWRTRRGASDLAVRNTAFPVSGDCLASLLRAHADSRESAIRQILGTVQRELGAQRAALFRLSDRDGLECLEAINYSHSEREDASFQPVRKILQECLYAPGSVPSFFPINENCCAFLVVMEERSRQLLYLDSELPGSLFSRMEQAEGDAVAAVLSSEFRAAGNLPGGRRQACRGGELAPYFGDDMSEVLARATDSLISDAPVIIHGETGTGKEQMARFIYTYGDYKGAFVPVQLSCLPEQLFESEMFGYEQGAFTGAQRRKIGFMELAHQGVLFLDEIADISPLVQTKLLRALQERSFTRVGGLRQQFSDFRLISATNKDLWEEVRAGRFREDLAYRLCVIPLELPPLRKRPRDLPVLIRQLHTHFLRRYRKPERAVSEQDMQRLLAYPWPGNIRELYSIMEQYVLFGNVRFRQQDAATETKTDWRAEDVFEDFPGIEEMQRRYIRHVLQRTNGKIYGPDGAAAILQMKKSTLYAKLKKFGLTRPDRP